MRPKPKPILDVSKQFANSSAIDWLYGMAALDGSQRFRCPPTPRQLESIEEKTLYDGSGPSVPGASRGSNTVWTYVEDDQIPEGVVISGDGNLVFAGLGCWDAKAALFEAAGDGTPLWVAEVSHQAVDPDVGASSDGTVLALVYTDMEQGSRVMKWSSDSPVPDWTYNVPLSVWAWPMRLEVSVDGSTIVAAGGDGIHKWVGCFSPDSSIPRWEVLTEGWGESLNEIDLSADGSTAVFGFMGGTYIVDVQAPRLLWQGEAMLGDAYAVSDDGSLVAMHEGYLLEYLHLLERDGDTYRDRWKYIVDGDWLYEVAEFSGDGSILIFGAWNWDDWGHNRLIAFDTSSNEPLWVMDQHSKGDLQDSVARGAVSEDGARFIVGFWGNDNRDLPEVMVMDTWAGEMVYGIHTPGSVFGVDITPDGMRATASCKSVHNNVPGLGGELYSIDLYNGLNVTVSGYPLAPIPAGDVLEFEVDIDNIGPVEERFDEVTLDVVSPFQRTFMLHEGLVVLAPGEHKHLDVSFDVPGATPPGTYGLEIVLRLSDYRACADSFQVEVE